MNCAGVERYLDAFVDGEVDVSARIEVERHLAACQACREQFAFADWLKRSLRSEGDVKAPEALRARVQEALDEERSPWVRIDASWRSTAAVAAMALFVFGVGGALEYRGERAQAGVAPIFEDVVRAHTRAYPAEVARREQVPAYFQQRVGFSVRPVEFSDPDVRFVGARHIEVGGRQAVTLQYEARGRRMTVVAFRAPTQAKLLGEQADAGGRSVRYVRAMGHLVPLVEHDGVVYAVVGDLDPEDRLMMAAHASLR